MKTYKSYKQTKNGTDPEYWRCVDHDADKQHAAVATMHNGIPTTCICGKWFEKITEQEARQ